MIKKILFFFSFLLMLGLLGCAVNLNVNRYELNSFCLRPHGHCSCYTLFVAEPTAQPGYDTDQMIYLKCPYQLQFFSRNRWVAPPHTMLTSLIAQSLRNTSFFKAVVVAPFTGDSQYRLETRLIKLQQEFFCCPSRIRMTIHAVVIDSHCRQAIGDRVFEVVIAAPENNPYSGVIAANKATNILLAQIGNFVICTIQQHPAIPIPSKYGIDIYSH